MLREKRTFWRKLLSLPSWERGLKFDVATGNSKTAEVAPLVGAWIEITSETIPSPVNIVAPLVGAWIEIVYCSVTILLCTVAPLVGAWIEISKYMVKVHHSTSLPSWERGLKSVTLPSNKPVSDVAPLVGAWIEMFARTSGSPCVLCRSPRGSVD